MYWAGWRHRDTAANRFVGKQRDLKFRRRTKKTVLERRGGGGAWRAFVSQRCKDEAKACFKELAEEYQGLSAEQKAELKEVGRAATCAHRNGGISFGAVARHLASMRVRMALLSSVSCTGLSRSGEARVLPRAPTALNAEAVVSEIVSAKTSALARKVLLRSQLEAEEQGTDAWHLGQVAITERDALFSRIPSLARHAPSLLGSPVSSQAWRFGVWQWCPPCGLEIPRLVSLCKKQEFHGVALAAISDWDARCALVRHDDCPALVEGDDGDGPSHMPSCLQARVCLCGDRGKAVFKFASWVHKSTARAFRADRDATVDAAFVFLRLSYYNTAHVDDEAVPTLDGFVHLPYFRWNPSAGVVREMGWPYNFVDEFNRAHLVATDVYRNTYQHADLVVDEGWRRIELRFYMLHESDRPLPYVNIRECEVELARGTETCTHWPKGKPRAKARPRDSPGDPHAAWDDVMGRLCDGSASSIEDRGGDVAGAGGDSGSDEDRREGSRGDEAAGRSIRKL